jgi:hypothetical protein
MSGYLLDNTTQYLRRQSFSYTWQREPEISQFSESPHRLYLLIFFNLYKFDYIHFRQELIDEVLGLMYYK